MLAKRSVTPLGVDPAVPGRGYTAQVFVASDGKLAYVVGVEIQKPHEWQTDARDLLPDIEYEDRLGPAPISMLELQLRASLEQADGSNR